MFWLAKSPKQGTHGIEVGNQVYCVSEIKNGRYCICRESHISEVIVCTRSPLSGFICVEPARRPGCRGPFPRRHRLGFDKRNFSVLEDQWTRGEVVLLNAVGINAL